MFSDFYLNPSFLFFFRDFWKQIKKCKKVGSEAQPKILNKAYRRSQTNWYKKKRQHCFCVLYAVQSKLYTKNNGIPLFFDNF